MSSAKELLLIDAVAWSPAYPDAPTRDVGGWFRQRLAPLSGLKTRTLSADAPLPPAALANARGVIISGSPRDAWSDDPVNAKLCALVRDCAARKIPLLGVCYGHQIVARALGAVVAPHPKGWELGNIPVELTPAGRKAALFSGLPGRFDMLSSHRDYVRELPPECELLATGDFTPIQAFHWRGILFGVQFHPEMNAEILRFLWGPRRADWQGRMPFDLNERLDTLQSPPDGGRILRNFAERIAA